MTRRNFIKATASTAVASMLPKKVFSSTYQKKSSILVVAHTDDEILWFLPWLDQFDKVIIASLPYTSAHHNIVQKYSANYDADWIFARGVTSFKDYREFWLNQKRRQAVITDWHYDRMLRDTIADPNVDEVWTHNPWGEYSHLHHRQVSEIVRKLACEYGKDVWCPNIVSEPYTYSYDSIPLPYYNKRFGTYDDEIAKQYRQYFWDEPVNETFPINYWTWGNYDDFPKGRQEWFLAVAQGQDLTIGDTEIEYLKESLPVYGV